MHAEPLARLLRPAHRSFFLFGARGTGKTTWLRQHFADATFLDLLDTTLQLQLTANPHALEALVGRKPAGAWVVLDEVQKIPALLDEVHRLIEARHWNFVLCGSSARKLRRGGANLLAGRALTLNMEPFCAAELGDRFDLKTALDWGLLPIVQLDPDHAVATLSAYVETYLREEIRAEGAIRNLAPFVRFLAVAGQLNGQILNVQNVAREAEVARSSVDAYFEILNDTLLAATLPSYRPGLKVRETTRPKFFWVDPGIARAAAGLLRDPTDGPWKGTALETLVFHEMRVYNAASGKQRPIAYYRTAAGAEIDFVIETRKRQGARKPRIVCIEVKLSSRWQRNWERTMRDLGRMPDIEVARRIAVYTGERPLHFDGLDVLPVDIFFAELHAGKVF